MDEQLLRDLVLQLRDLVPALKSMSGTGSSASKNTDRLVAAIGKLTGAVDRREKSLKNFFKEVDEAADKFGKTTARASDRVEVAGDKIEQASEQIAAATKQQVQASKIAAAAENLQKERKRRWESKEISTAGDLIDEYSRGVTGTAALREKFESLGGSSMGLNVAARLSSAALEGLGKSITQYAAAMYEGEQGAEVSAKAITAFTDTVATAAQALGGILLVIPGFQVLGAGLIAAGTGAKALGKGMELAAAQSDRLYTTYQDLSKSGIVAADGMVGVAQSAQRMGYGLDRVGLDQFAKLMHGASQDLALMSGSAVTGRKRFADLSTALTKGQLGRNFMNLGMSVDEINQSMASYINNEVRMGRAASQTQTQLREGSIKYIRELDLLAKLTGQQARDIQKRMDDDAREERFRAALIKIERTEGRDAAENLRKNVAAVGARFPELAQSLKDTAAGYITTEAGAKGFRAGMMGVTEEMKKGLGRGLNQLGMAAGRTVDSFGESLGAVGAFNNTFGNLAELAEARQLAEKDQVQAIRDLTRQQAQQESGADGLVGAQTDLRRQQMNARDSLQSFVNLGVNPATRALQTLSGVPAAAAGALPGEAAGGRFGQGGSPTAPAFSKGGPAQPVTGDYLNRLMQLESGGRNIATQVGGGTSSAFGLYQITKTTFDSLAANAPPGSPLRGKSFEDMKADVELQKVAATMLTDQNARMLARRGLSTSDAAKYMAHVLGYPTAAKVLESNASMSISKVVDDRSRLNNPSIFRDVSTVGDLRKKFSDITGGGGYRYGGIATGPKSGYAAMLHGTEAIIPLNGGRSIKVDMPDFASSMRGQMDAMSAQISRLDEMVQLMRTQASISQKILQVSQS